MSVVAMFARGPWKVNAPFVVDPNLIYTMVADRSFREMEAEGIGVYDQVYRPAGLTQEQCETDRLNAVTILVLETDGKPNVFVPFSYVAEYPTASAEGYSRVVMGMDMGIMSDKIDLSYLKEKMQQAAQDITGQQNVKVELILAPYSGVITPEQGELMEANRLALIKNGNNHYAENKKLIDELALERAKVQRLEQIIIQNAIPT